MKFIHAVVFTESEFNEGNYDTGDWRDLTEGDYVVHCLYSVDNKEVLFAEDNTHAPVESNMDAFFFGLEFAGHEAVVDRAIVIVKDNESPYTIETLEEYFLNCRYTEVM
jgi:hypothetical protein